MMAWWQDRAKKAKKQSHSGKGAVSKDIESLGDAVAKEINEDSETLPFLLSAAGIVVKKAGKFGARGLFNVVNDLWGGGVYKDGE